MDRAMRHIFKGMSRRVYCGARIYTQQRHLLAGVQAPLTEGEFLDGLVPRGEICEDCARACAAVRGMPR